MKNYTFDFYTLIPYSAKETYKYTKTVTAFDIHEAMETVITECEKNTARTGDEYNAMLSENWLQCK
jgi:hypothetical protein